MNHFHRITTALMVWRDDDLKFRTAVDVVDFNQLHQTNQNAVSVFNDKASFCVIVNVFTVKFFEFVIGS